LAELAGTTVRTVRYYHQVGLLPVPRERLGYRDYDLAHVARLIRIRWLTEAGVPLSRVADMLRGSVEGAVEAERQSVRTDLNATLVALEAQAELLRERQERVRSLIAAVEKHDRLSPLPAPIARFYDAMECRAQEERVRRVIRRERDIVELAFYRGEMPPEAAVLYQGLDEARLAESAALFEQVADRYEAAAPPEDEQIARVASKVVERIRRHLGPEFPPLARSLALARQVADMYVRLADDKTRPVDRAIAEALLAAIEEARAE
jgi:DNA-binding transcriptional MerR regulator